MVYLVNAFNSDASLRAMSMNSSGYEAQAATPQFRKKPFFAKNRFLPVS
jgi:hypothetical protein